MFYNMLEQAQSRRRFAGKRIGLTGGIGSGKSSAGKIFGELGFRVLDVDEVVKTRVLVDAGVLSEAKERWGDDVVCAGGGLDRARVAAIVFGDAEERRWWEGVVHPRVGRLWRAELAAEPEANWVVEIPLLFEAGLEKEFDFVVCVAANERTQLNRAVARGLSPAQVEKRIASQLPLEIKLKSAHVVLWNEGSREFLARQVRELAQGWRDVSSRG
jgi:dephospho-CoA kinase